MKAMPINANATAGRWPVAALRAGFASPIINDTLISGFRALAVETEHSAEKSAARHGTGVAAHDYLNAFFAISANSPSMSMVNFSCCVCSAPTSCAPGVTRGMTAQPMRVAGRTKAGAHARL
jgi:hypothetical protein